MNNKVYDISGKKKIWFIISLALIAAIAVITVIKGVEIAIEFKGGTIISYSYEGDASIKDAQSEIEDLLKTPVVIQEGENLSNDSNSFSISFSYDTGLSVEDQTALTELLQEKIPDNKVELLDSNDVNPTSGKEFFLKMCNCFDSCRSTDNHLYCFEIQKISGWSAGVCGYRTSPQLDFRFWYIRYYGL